MTLMNKVRIKPVYGENYDSQWGKIDYTNKVVLDIGSNYGSTADFFLRNGAKQVICVDSSKKHIDKLHKHIEDFNWYDIVKAHYLRVDKNGHFSGLIYKYEPDVVKSDCEGCEVHLFNIPNEEFCKVPEYIIEVHSDSIFESMKKKCKECNYEIIDINAWAGVVKIVYAKRRD